MLYTENLGLRDCVGFSQIQSHIYIYKAVDIIVPDLGKEINGFETVVNKI